jgi:SAM-dependent methyltransferase
MTPHLSCPVCGGRPSTQFLHRAGVPVHQNLALPSREKALEIPRGELTLNACPACGFIFNSSFDSRKLSYGADYDNTQSHSGYFAEYMTQLSKLLLNDKGIHNCSIVEVGCGKGEFLRLLVQDPLNGNTGTGFDLSYVGPETDLDGRLRFIRSFYNRESSRFPADVVVCRHVIEHVPHPLELLLAIRQALGANSEARIFFETPCVEWILRNRVIWDFFYEHCSLFSASSLSTAFERAGFSVHMVEHLFGGQYLWLEATPAYNRINRPANAGSISKLAQDFAMAEKELQLKWQKKLIALRQNGNVAIWGAGAKGTTFAHLVDPHCQLVDCLVDLNPNKQGKFVAGTGHTIVGPDSLRDRNISAAILMNPNYRAENEIILREAGLDITLIGNEL